MKEGWEYKEVGDLFKTYSGGTPHKSHSEYYDGGTIPWLMSGEVCQKYITNTELYITELGLKNSSAKYYPKNTVVVAMYGATAAQVGILKITATSNQAVCGILPNDDFIPEFIYYWFTYIKENLAAQAQGGAQPNLSQIKIKKVLIPNISLAEQQQIVSFLDSEFEKIDALKANAEKQLQAAKDLFQAALKELLTPKEGWVEKKLGEVLSKLTDGSHNPPKGLNQSPYKMLSSRNIGDNCLQDLDNVRYLSKTDFEFENKRTNAQPNDVLLTIVGTIGRCAVLRECDLPITLQRSVAVMTPQNVLESKFLMYFFASSNSTLSKEAQGVAQKGIYLNQLRNIPIDYPSLPKQQAITAQLDELSAKVKSLQVNYEQTITLCNDLKQALLKKVFG